MTPINLIFYTLLGAVVGSFLNVVVDRLPKAQSLLSPPSQCDQCGRRLSPLELIPIFSYLWLRGRCRTCGKPIPARVLVVEIAASLVFVLTWLGYGPSWTTPLYSLYGSLMIVLASIDLENHKLPNLLIYPAIGLGLIMIPFLHLDHPWMTLAGGFLGFAVLFLIAVLAPGAMGMGDVKLVLFLGIIIGFPGIILVLLLAFVSGGLIAGILLALKRIGRKDSIAFGPFLAFAGFVTLLYGSQILDWWLRRVSG
jgi:leader peptidase (prepilin peptidase)/N-methyltransferase